MFRYFVRLARSLGLRGWEFEFDDGEPETATGSTFLADADVRINDESDAATLRIGSHLIGNPTADPVYIRRVLIHEALHCHRAKTSTMVRLDLEKMLGAAADSLFWRQYARLREHEIEAVARAIAPHYPLPPWAAAPKR